MDCGCAETLHEHDSVGGGRDMIDLNAGRFYENLHVPLQLLVSSL